MRSRGATGAGPAAPRGCAPRSNPHGFTTTTSGSSAASCSLPSVGACSPGRVTSGCAARQRDELGHPHPSDHHGIHPLDREHGRPATGLLRARGDERDPRQEIPDDRLARVGPADGAGHAPDVLPDVVEARRMKVRDAHGLSRPGLHQASDGGAHVVERDRADVAEVLRDDDLRRRPAEPLDVDLVDRQRILEHRADGRVDLPALDDRADPRARQHRHRARFPAGSRIRGSGRRAALGLQGRRRSRWPMAAAKRCARRAD